jgi:hypothetical protein
LVYTDSATTTDAVELLGGFKIRLLEMWTPAFFSSTASALESSASITWTGGGIGRQEQLCSNSLSTAKPSYLSTTPPKGSEASFWCTAGGTSNSYFTINQSVKAAFLDLTMDCVLSNGTYNTTTLNSTSYPNQFYYGRLDGNGSVGVWTAVTGSTDIGVE